MRNLRTRFLVPLNDSVHIKSGHVELDPLSRDQGQGACVIKYYDGGDSLKVWGQNSSPDTPCIRFKRLLNKIIQ